jgi:acetyl esterase/lipase
MNRRSISNLLLLGFSYASCTASPSTSQTIELWPEEAPVEEGVTEKSNARITVYHPQTPNGTAMVICPGGGYGTLVKGPEGTGIANWLNQNGITGIVLEYRLPKGKAFRPLNDAQRAIRIARKNAKDWKIDPNKIGIIGFSAGGHLASTAATHFNQGDPDHTDPFEQLSCRPDFAILVYPVITMGNGAHLGSRRNLLGKEPNPKMLDLFSNEKQVSKNTPPVFLTHAKNDAVVPVAHSQMFHEALKANGVPSRYLELPTGNHGLNGYKGPMWDAWQTQSLEWLKTMKFIK